MLPFLSPDPTHVELDGNLCLPLSLYQKIRNLFTKEPTPFAPAWPLIQGLAHRPRMHLQLQSPFFNKLSPEIRIMIYQEALACIPGVRYFRDLGLSWPENLKAVKEWQTYVCDPAPIEWDSDERGNVFPRFDWPYHPRLRKRASLLALLLTARRVYVSTSLHCLSTQVISPTPAPRLIRTSYFETLGILYKEKSISFEGALPLLNFQASIPAPQFSALSHVQLRTWFIEKFVLNPLPLTEKCATEHLQHWERCFDELARVPSLRSLRVSFGFRRGLPVGDDALFAVLSPMRRVTQPAEYLVYCHEYVSPAVREALRPLPFELQDDPDQYYEWVQDYGNKEEAAALRAAAAVPGHPGLFYSGPPPWPNQSS